VSADAVESLLARHEQLPARAQAAARVLQLCDDPDTSAQQLARAIGTDPVFAAKVLRVANSSYYGLSGRVSTLPFAVSVVGFQTVRSLAVVAAAGLDDPNATPSGFWEGAALSATAAEVFAPLLEADSGDAFSLGLLHTLGSALLHQHRPLGLVCLPEPDDATTLATAELAGYGTTHEVVGARVLSMWHFPDRVCTLIARHHEPVLPDASPLERTLHAARGVADGLLRGGPPDGLETSIAWLTDGRVSPDELPALFDRVQDRASALLDGLQTRR
jgi:HD-like signal output (HDOD) protein